MATDEERKHYEASTLFVDWQYLDKANWKEFISNAPTPWCKHRCTSGLEMSKCQAPNWSSS